ncbi:competence type IV pilus minor pilin ComGF [Jeotgalibacillus malaysiensis]|uniref:competence type IV pilus minor pilin ComGF n=1 Tax=Jeotgalibacillus malaysiensis TaxID=1508404 RepID=UPI00384B8FC9
MKLIHQRFAFEIMKKKKFALISNCDGFTMLEVMISVAILTLIAPLFAMLIFSYSHLISMQNHSKEWDLFSIQFQNEISGMVVASNTAQSITLHKGNDKVVFSKYGSVLRKTVNGTGHEIHLTGITDLNFSTDGEIITMGVRFVNGDDKKSLFYSAPDE